MRAQAKRSSAAHRDGSASRGSASGSRSAATRGSSPDANGGAASWRHRAAIAVGLVAVALLSFVPIAQAKVVVDGILSGNGPGEVSSPEGVAIDSSGVGAPAGTFYVAESNRLQRFTPSGSFERIWGNNAVKSGGSGDKGNSNEFLEVCTVASECTIGNSGGFFNGGPSGIAVSPTNGNVYFFEGGSRRVMEFSPAGTFIRTWGWDVVLSGKPNDVGTNAFEICDAEAGNVLSDCQSADNGSNGGQFLQADGELTVDSSGNVWVADPLNGRIQKFGPNGSFIAAYGHDVDALGGSGGLEECTSVAVGACKAGTQGSGAGQFSANNPRDFAFDSSGNLYAVDAGNNRVQKFDPTLLSSATDFGAATFAPYITSWAPESFHPLVQVASAPGGQLLFALRNANPQEYRILEIDPSDASVDEEMLVGSQLGSINDLAADFGSERLYATTGFESGSPYGLLIFGDPLPSPAMVLDPITVKTDTTATFSGSVDPKGGLVSCKFQYSTDQSNWTDVALSECKTADIDGGPFPVNANLTNLIPNQKYFVRLQTSRPLVAGSTVTTGARHFETDAPPPIVSDVGAIQVGNTSARLVGTIDTRHSDTGYIFEYGLTPAFGSVTPAVNIGDGTSPITVSQIITGLKPDTTYYFRLVATNLTGQTPSPGHTFHTRTAPFALPEDRGYEMVTPPEKNYTDIDNHPLLDATAGISLDGNAAGFCTTGLFGEPPGQMTIYCAPYVSRRTPGGWETTNPFPSYCHFDPDATSEQVAAEGFMEVHPSDDFSRFVFNKPESAGCPIPPLDPAAPLIPGRLSFNLYRQDQTTDPFRYDLLHPNDGGQAQIGQRFIGGSVDFSHAIYQSNLNQTPPPDSPPPGDFRKIYDWEEEGHGDCTQPGGCLTLISKDPAGVPFTTPSNVATKDGGGDGFFVHSAISRDGERIFFQNPVAANGIPTPNSCATPGCQVYMREAGAVTFEVSASECSVDCGSPQAVADNFLSATPSGDVAFFSSCAKLTDESSAAESCLDPTSSQGTIMNRGVKLYRWDRNAPPGQRLTDLTVDNEPSDGSQPDLQALIGHSDDGEIAYFVAGGQTFPQPSPGGQIVSGEPTFNGGKLYRWRWNGGSPTVDYLGPYKGPYGQYFGGVGEVNASQRLRTVTPDGRHLLIYSHLAHDKAGDRDADVDLYRWDENGGWICISCQEPGLPSAGDVSLDFEPWLNTTIFNYYRSEAPKILISDDGQKVFFASPEALVPEDVNGEAGCPDIDVFQFETLFSCQDVYEWHDGTVRLLSTGTGPSPSRLLGATPSGDSVFIFTRDRLVGWDIDTNMDIYDARVGGGFPEPPPAPVQCEGEACRGPGTVAVPTTGAGSAVFQGPGNGRSKPKPLACSKGKRRVRRGGKVRCVRKNRRTAKSNRRAAR